MAVALPPFRDRALLYAAVIAGGVIGALLRALVSLAFAPGMGFPWATLFVNVTGSFGIGLYAALTGPQGRLTAGPRQHAFVTTGICSGYTTFSMFSLETLRLWQAGETLSAGLYVGVSLIAWLAAVWLGYALGTRFDRSNGVS
jgi:CrcB protein